MGCFLPPDISSRKFLLFQMDGSENEFERCGQASGLFGRLSCFSAGQSVGAHESLEGFLSTISDALGLGSGRRHPSP